MPYKDEGHKDDSDVKKDKPVVYKKCSEMLEQLQKYKNSYQYKAELIIHRKTNHRLQMLKAKNYTELKKSPGFLKSITILLNC